MSTIITKKQFNNHIYKTEIAGRPFSLEFGKGASDGILHLPVFLRSMAQCLFTQQFRSLHQRGSKAGQTPSFHVDICIGFHRAAGKVLLTDTHNR